MNPQFTIVTPSFNYARFLGDCLESVRAQRGASWEHWVIDAGSTDGTLDMLRRQAHLKVLVEPDKGMSDAINKGFRCAAGQWVMWLNADDRLKPGALAEVARCADRHPEADVIFGSYDFVDAGGQHLRRMKLLPYSRFVSVHHGCYVPSTAAFYRKATVLDAGFQVDERFRTVMDGEFYARLSRAGKRFHYLPCVLADFRVHEDNASAVGQAPQRGTLDAELAAARAAVETMAVRRTYGFTPFSHYIGNHVSDFALYFLAWGLKGLLKLPWSFRLRTPALVEGGQYH